MSELIWRPTAEYLDGANLSRFMARYGIGSYEEMVRRSVEDVAWYWSQVERDLGLEWERPYDRVLDTHQGIEWATWFGGGLINIAHNCVDRHAASEAAERTAVIEEREDGSVRSRTYRELAAEVGRLANGLRSIGIARGDRVGVYLPMCVEAVVSMMAIAKIGAVYLPVFSGFAPAAVAARLEDAGARALISADGYRHRGKLIRMKEAADEAAHMVHLPITLILRHAGRDVEWHRRHDVVWDELLAEQPTEAPTEPTEAEDVWMIAYTSGTTGRPKGAVHVHGGFLVKVAAEVAYQVDCRPGDVLHWVTDMGWIMGPWETVGTLALGGTVLLYEGAPTHPGPDRLWALCERHGVTILGLSPTLIRSLMPSGTGPVESHDLSHLRILASTGEPWNPEPYRWYFEHAGGGRCPVINLSGGTEIGACLLSPYPITALKTATLRGPSLGMDVDVVDAEGHPVRGGVGELVCRQPWPSMTRGIWGDPDRYLAAYWSAIPGVWHHGDWASIDEDGFWFLHGRSDDTINVAGRRIGPAEIESVLVSDPAVVEAAVVGLPHEVKGEALWCFCILAGEPEEGLATRLEDLIDATIGKPFRPERVVFVRDLPRTRSAKIVRRAIRAVVRGEDPGDISSLENPGALAAIESALVQQ